MSHTVEREGGGQRGRERHIIFYLFILLQHLSSYAAFQQFPYEVSQLQELEPKLSGGCTAVLAVVVEDRLYVANVGDSRALLVRQQPDETLTVQQLSVDHSVENEDELKRLEALGLDPRVLIQSGRLGMHENTRSIGDYSIKKGYKDTDTRRLVPPPPSLPPSPLLFSCCAELLGQHLVLQHPI